MSTYQVARASGGGITHQTVWSVANNQAADIKLSTMLALSKALKLPLDAIVDAALGRIHRDVGGMETRLLEKFRELPEQWRPGLIEIVDTLLNQYVKPAEVRKPRAAKLKHRTA